MGVQHPGTGWALGRTGASARCSLSVKPAWHPQPLGAQHHTGGTRGSAAPPGALGRARMQQAMGGQQGLGDVCLGEPGQLSPGYLGVPAPSCPTARPQRPAHAQSPSGIRGCGKHPALCRGWGTGSGCEACSGLLGEMRAAGSADASARHFKEQRSSLWDFQLLRAAEGRPVAGFLQRFNAVVTTNNIFRYAI